MAKNNYLNVLLISWSWIIWGLINYAYHPIMLHYLSLQEFGTFWSLVGMFNILGILTVWFVLFLNKEISKNIKDESKIKFIFLESLKLFFYIWLGAYLFYFLFSGIIADFLNIKDIKLIWIVWIAIIFSFIWISENATLRGLKKFEFMSILGIISPIFKLALWFLLVFFGLKVFWAILGFVLGWIFTFVISLSYLFKYFKNTPQKWNLKDLLWDFKNNKREIINFFFVSLFFAIFMNIDVILAKNIFDDKVAWIYAWLSVLGKFLIFLLLSIETVYYSQIMEYSKKELPKYLIKNPVFLTIIISVLALVFNYFLGHFILNILKPELAENTWIYLLILVYFSLLSLISFFSKILIWWKNYLVNYFLAFLSIFLIILVYSFWKESLYDFVYSFIITWIIWIIWVSYLFFREFRIWKK